MSTEQTRTSHGVMESGGSYNRHAKLPSEAASAVAPLWEKTVRSLPIADGKRPIVIADYGSSQGKNSLGPMRLAIKLLRERAGAGRAISVVHVDQAANDFNALFEVLHNDPERYSAGDANVFSCAVGRSFYERVVPDEQVDLGWCSYAVVWLRRAPALVPGHFVVTASTGEVRAAFDRQAAEDWSVFLALRAAELRGGARMMVAQPGVDDDGLTGFEPLFDRANEAIASLVASGAITVDDRARMVIGVYPRQGAQLSAPFAGGEFHSLTMEHCERFPLADAAWADFETDRDAKRFAARHAQFFRSVFVPSLANAISNPARRAAFPDLLVSELARQIAEKPTPIHSYVQTIVIRKN